VELGIGVKGGGWGGGFGGGVGAGVGGEINLDKRARLGRGAVRGGREGGEGRAKR